MSNTARQSPLVSCDLAAIEDAVVDGNAKAWSDVDIEELLRSHEAELVRDYPTKAEDVKKAKKEALRRRHRKNMAVARSRQGQRMESMRKQYQHLWEKLASSVGAWKQLRETLASGGGTERDAIAGGEDDSGYTSGSPSSTTVGASSVAHSELYSKYVAAVETENAIHKENEALTRRLKKLAIYETMLRVDTPQEMLPGIPSRLEEESKKSSGRHGPLNRPGYWSYFANDTEPFYYVPFSAPQTRLLIRGMYDAYQSHHKRFMAELVHQHCRDRMKFFGWTVQRKVIDGTQFHFHFTKFLPCSDSSELAEDMAEKCWRVFNSPEKFKKLYRTAMEVRVLQRVDPFTTVLMRNAPDASGSHRTRHLTLKSKITDVDALGQKSLVILMLVVEPPEDATSSGKSHVRFIRDSRTYMRFDIRTDGVQFTYGGHGDCLNPALTKYLFLETGNVLLRFEQMIRSSNLITCN